MSKNIEQILDKDKILAIVGKTKEIGGKSNFITPNEFGIQLVVQNSNQEDYWAPHKHPPFENLNFLAAQEFIYVIQGKISVGIYSKKDEKFTERTLNPGEFIILNSGHELKSLEKGTKYIAIKQGPYREGEKEYIK
ncbi:MAG: hypothetical protein AABX99_03945 [Nanoarchaeota archaeon]